MSATDGLGSHAGPRADMSHEEEPVRGTDDYSYSGRAIVADMTSTFAAVLLVVLAGLEILQGIAQIANDEIFAVTPKYVFRFDVTAWGWIHLILGIAALVVAFGILRQASWALVGGVVIAVLSVFSNFASIPYYPFWSLTVIAFNILVIWALCTRRAHPD